MQHKENLCKKQQEKIKSKQQATIYKHQTIHAKTTTYAKTAETTT